MSISILPLSPKRLGITGDLETELRIPFDSDEDRFHVAVSDGPLIAGEYDRHEDRFHYQVEIEGAGIVRIKEGTIRIDWRVEWVTIGLYQAEVHPPGAFSPRRCPFSADLKGAQEASSLLCDRKKLVRKGASERYRIVERCL